MPSLEEAGPGCRPLRLFGLGVFSPQNKLGLVITTFLLRERWSLGVYSRR